MRYFLLFFLFLASCDPKTMHGPRSIGRDPTWYPLSLDLMAANVNGFTNELIQILSKKDSSYQIVDTDWSQLREGLKEHHYAAIFTSMTPDLKNKTHYSFSDPFINLGPVLIVRSEAPVTSLGDLGDCLIGVCEYDDSVLVAQTNPSLVIQTYQNKPNALDALAKGEIDALLMATLDAHALVSRHYPARLKIASKPLTDKGLRLATLKGKYKSLIRHFNATLEQLKETEAYRDLKEKFMIPT